MVLTPRRPATVLELWTPRFFEMLMNGFSKHSNNIFTRTSMDAKCFVLVLVIYVLDFQKNFSKEKTKFFSVDANTKMSNLQMAIHMCCINNHNNGAQRVKEMTDIHQNKIELEKSI